MKIRTLIGVLVLVSGTPFPSFGLEAGGENPPGDAKPDLTLGLSPLRLDLRLKPGEPFTQSVRVANPGTVAVQIRGAVMDWVMSPSGEVAYVKSGAAGLFGCGAWIRMNPLEFPLPPGAEQVVRYTVSVPAGAAPGGYHCGLVFDMLPPPRSQQAGMGIVNLIRLVTTTYITLGAPEVRAEIERLELKPLDGGKEGWEVRTSFRNPGTTHYRVRGTVELTTREGAPVRSFDYADFPVLPASPRTVVFEVPGPLPPGVYRLRAVVDVGRPERLAAEAEVTVAAR